MRTVAPKNIDISAGGFTSPYTVQVGSDSEVLTFYGTKTLSSGFAIQASGTPSDHCTITMLFIDATPITPASNTFSIFGVTLPTDMISNSFYALCYYTNSAWSVWYGLIAGIPYKTGGGLGVDGTTGGLIIAPNEIVNAMVKTSAAIAYSKLALTGGILNADINAAAAIAYTKLALTGAILNADINAAAAIAYSKLALTGSILNADVNAAAAIALSKLAALTASEMVISNGSGVMVSAPVATYPSLTELSYVKGLSSAVQTQLTAKAATTYVDAADLVLTNAIAAINTAVKTWTTVTGTTILTAATIKNIVLCDTTGGAFTTTLPLISTIADGYEIKMSCVGHVSNVATIACNASDHIVDQDSVGGVGTLTMAGYWNSYTLRADASTHTWYVVVKITV
jgi:hypothetical protein